MKQLILICSFLILYSTTAFSKTYYPVSVYLTDGTTKKGLAEIVETLTLEPVSFKASEGAKSEKLEASTIKKLVYSFADGNVDFVQVSLYKGLKQEKTKGPFWAHVYIEDIVSVYCIYTTIEGSIAGNFNSRTSAGFTDYYLMRDGEPAAKMVIKTDQRFNDIAVKYFADYSELLTRIKDDEFGWKDFEEVVNIYNKWANENKQ